MAFKLKYNFRCNLLKLYQNLSDEDVKDLVYISPECPENVTHGREYFRQLERKGLISPTNYDYILDRLAHIKKKDLAVQLMERIIQSPHTPSSLLIHLLVFLHTSGKEDLVVEFMKCKCPVQRLPSGFTLSNQTLLMVFNAKRGTCTAYTEAIAQVCGPDGIKKVGGLLEEHFHQIVLQSTKVNMEATVYQWSSFSVFEDRGILGELLENTLESVFSFTDAYCTYIGSVLNSETVQLESIRPSATVCNSAFDRFSEALTGSEWNPGGRQDAVDRKTKRDFQLDLLTQFACKAIADVCEGFCCEKKLEEAEGLAKEELFNIVTGMYACWYSTPMYHWMRTLIQMAASSKLDLTKYHDLIMKVVSVHREPIIKYYSKFTQLLGKDVMKMVDPVLNVPQDKTVSSEKATVTTTPTTDNCAHVEYMAVYWYMYLLQLVALADSSSSSQWEMAERFANIHQAFHQKSYAEILQSSMEVARKLIVAGHAQVENFKQRVIQLFPESSTEKVLFSKLLHVSDVDTHQ